MPVVAATQAEAPAAQQMPEATIPCTPEAPVAQETPKKKKKTGLIVGIVVAAVVVVAIVVGIVFVLPMIQNNKAYNEAKELIEQGEIDDAIELLEDLGDYKDCADLVEELEDKQDQYDQAKDLLKDGRIEEALVILEELETFRDSADLLKKWGDKQKQYQEALNLLEQNQHDDAYQIFTELGDYKDCVIYTQQIEEKINNYDYAVELMENGDFEGAIALFSSLSDFRDSEEMATRTVPEKWADFCVAEGERTGRTSWYDTAAEMYMQIGLDSKAMESYLAAGRILLNNRDWDGVTRYMNVMDKETLEIFREECSAYSADAEALEKVRYCATAFTEAGERNAAYVALTREMYNTMQPYVSRFYLDTQLQELIQQYTEGIWDEYVNMNYDGSVLNQTDYYKAWAKQFQAIDEMIASHGLFADDPETYEKYVGLGDYWGDYAFLLEDMYQQVNNQPLKNDTYNGQYIELTNNTDRVVELGYYFEFLYWNEPVANSEWTEIVIQPGETVALWLNEPRNCPYWDCWLFYRTVEFAE